MFEAVQFIDHSTPPGGPLEQETLGNFETEADAVAAARIARAGFQAAEDYAWWIVRQRGAPLARWIADSRSAKEFVLDLTSGELVEVP